MLRAANIKVSVFLMVPVVLLSQVSADEWSSHSDSPAVGARGRVGCDQNPKTVGRLFIKKSGIYENYLVDGKWVSRNLVKINADDVILRHCEIRNGMHNGVTVYAQNVLIESCQIHHLLKGTYKNQRDAHGITGRPTKLTIRNCEIYQVSGDSVQFDPDRGPWDDVLIENCTLWTAPLTADTAGFKKGERPGENAVDTKQQIMNPRSKLTIRNCLMYGWGNGQIKVMAALNLKNHVQVRVEQCLFRDNEICFRLRGVTGKRGGALVTIKDCAVYRSKVAVRMDDRIRDLKITRIGIGDGVRRTFYRAGGGVGLGFENTGAYDAPPFEQLLKTGF